MSLKKHWGKVFSHIRPIQNIRTFKLTIWFQFYELHFNTMLSHCFLPGVAIQVSFLLHGKPSVLNRHLMMYQQRRKEFPPTNWIAGRRQEFKWHVSHRQMRNDENISFCNSLKMNYIGQLKKGKYWHSLNYIRKEKTIKEKWARQSPIFSYLLWSNNENVPALQNASGDKTCKTKPWLSSLLEKKPKPKQHNKKNKLEVSSTAK